MYKEEFSDFEIDSNSSSENLPKAKEDVQSFADPEEPKTTNVAGSQTSQVGDSRPCVIPAINGVESATAFQNEPTIQISGMNTKISNQRPIGGDSSFLQDAIDDADQSGRFFAYHIADLGQFGNSGVSLALGLRQCDVGLPISDNQRRLWHNQYSCVSQIPMPMITKMSGSTTRICFNTSTT